MDVAELLVKRFDDYGEHSDFFAKNLIALRCEERLALVVTAPWALVTGSYPTP